MSNTTEAHGRFMSKVRQTDGCWEWCGSRNRDGYGVFHFNSEHIRAHRWSVQNLKGESIPPGMQVDHICRNRACVRPEHLRVVTPGENTLAPGSMSPSAINNRKTSADCGHPFTGMTIDSKGRPYRMCKKCKNAYDREWRAKNKEWWNERRRDEYRKAREA